MANTLVRVFDRFSDAENARNALLAAGFPPACVRLDPREDEAGPVEGNFVLEYKDKDPEQGDDRSLFDAALGRDDPNEGLGHSEVAWRASDLLIVEANNDEQFALASEIASRYGGFDVSERYARWKAKH